MCDVITVGLNIALVLWNNEIKNMSDKKLNDNDT